MSSSLDASTPTGRATAASQPLRRLTLELFVVIALKVALLALLWWLLFARQPAPDASPAAISRVLAPSAATTGEVRP